MWKKVMQQVHQDLPNKDFEKTSEGLTTVKVCADSGMLCTDACSADLRGNRAVSVVVAVGTEPTEPCTLHSFQSYCGEGKCLSTEFCPASSVAQVGLLNYIREDYGASIVAEDDLYTIGGQEKAMGLRPTIAEDGTEVYPEVIGCPVHTTAGPVTDTPIVIDPSNPGTPGTPGVEPPYHVTEDGDIIFPTVPEQPTTPEVPVEPVEPTVPTEPSGTEDWWGDFWAEPTA